MNRLKQLSLVFRPLIASGHLEQIRHKGHTPTKQAHVMKKLISGKTKNKGFWYRERDPKPVLAKDLSTTHRQVKGASRRVVVLNKLFMKYVTDIMATGEVSQIVLGRGIEITRVRMSLDFQLLSVYWMGNDSKVSDEHIEDVLKRTAGLLRHELSQLRLMGEVPRITFIKDKQYAELSELDRRLAIADYGDDHEPGQLAHREFSPLFRTTSVGEDGMPAMRYDVFSLNHEQIMNRVLVGMSKVRNAQAQRDGLIQANDLTSSEIGVVTTEMIERAHAEQGMNADLLRDFLNKRKVEKKKRHKAMESHELHADEYDDARSDDDFSDYEDDSYDVQESYEYYQNDSSSKRV